MGRNNGFTFKQFHIDHDRCAMKVGTDGILLGAWAPVDSARRVLDIGTGSGLIALMLAQRSTNGCHIDGVELDKDAAMQAQENAAASPWRERVTIIESAIQDHLAPPYDLIVSNPPYVDSEDMSDLPEEFRHEPELALASGSDGLKLTKRLLANAADFLKEDGVLVVEVGNSMIHLEAQFPEVPFTWVEFENGGHGVFVMTRAELEQYQAHFAIYKN